MSYLSVKQQQLEAMKARVEQQEICQKHSGRPIGIGRCTEDGYLEYTEPTEAWRKENKKLHKLMRAEQKAFALKDDIFENEF